MDQSPPHAQEQVDLLSTLEVIEAQPLASRAAAYAGVHDALARKLDSGPTTAPPRP